MAHFSYKRSERVAGLLLEEISTLIQHELKDPRIGFVTLTEARVSDDLRHARIWVSVRGDEARKRGSLVGLRAAIPFIRRRLGETLALRFIPRLEFTLDRTLERVARIDELLARVRRSSEEGSGGAGG